MTTIFSNSKWYLSAGQCAIIHELYGNGFRNEKKTSQCCPGAQTPWILSHQVLVFNVFDQ